MIEHRNNRRDPDDDTLHSDELFDLLSSTARRIILFHLRQHGAATVDELVDVLAEVGEYDRQLASVELFHVHLPELQRLGLLTYDVDEQIVESTAYLREIREWLDLAVRRDIRFEIDDAEAREDPETDAGYTEFLQVLLVDDEPGLPETIAAYVEEQHDDIVVTTAASALEAVTRLEEEKFDCIVSDYQMPAISGLDFLKAVREQDDEIPFIVFTAKGSETTASEAISSDVTDYVQKKPGVGQYDVLIDRIRKAVADD
ncbi:response regulator [Halogeometricum limi]|uniref:Response regulator receiver domain-containing protein n=1 Tax=Halogeometricum limi TaxID=555875 RepID=A0A1I6FVD2_9EURY|nr:response regulator [Halogeometricum limi]SFR33890.1 Response regulator receiver domain-containing protein [Halogeometricum limi]